MAAAHAQGMSWPLAQDQDDAAFKAQLFPAPPVIPPSRFAAPDWGTVHAELAGQGVTLKLLWEEYREGQTGKTYSYSLFCARYRTFRGRLKRSLRQTHVAGEKCFTDTAGPTVGVVDARTGEVRQAQIFVAVLGASNYTYCGIGVFCRNRRWPGWGILLTGAGGYGGSCRRLGPQCGRYRA